MNYYAAMILSVSFVTSLASAEMFHFPEGNEKPRFDTLPTERVPDLGILGKADLNDEDRENLRRAQEIISKMGRPIVDAAGKPAARDSRLFPGLPPGGSKTGVDFDMLSRYDSEMTQARKEQRVEERRKIYRSIDTPTEKVREKYEAAFRKLYDESTYMKRMPEFLETSKKAQAAERKSAKAEGRKPLSDQQIEAKVAAAMNAKYPLFNDLENLTGGALSKGLAAAGKSQAEIDAFVADINHFRTANSITPAEAEKLYLQIKELGLPPTIILNSQIGDFNHQDADISMMKTMALRMVHEKFTSEN